ncbi:endonuclease [Clavibacter phage CMP1]|uniref:Endonuclease n=1 Tax=Clavibacter phage CMP1 TaxID=686439 RepID=D0U234_9CAUD|nr:HNH endonuclease [Clavibacter phage CMP1]ACY35946.1 endonuclease [Clavibacter phage CMP1]
MATDTERFWAKVRKTETCWVWTGAPNGDGYAYFYTHNKGFSAHRLSYEAVNGKIPDGLQIDHLCRNRMCVRPDHLEAVTQQENIKRGGVGWKNKRKTHCPKNHEYTPSNTYINPRGSRVCRTCNRNDVNARNERNRNAHAKSR